MEQISPSSAAGGLVRTDPKRLFAVRATGLLDTPADAAIDRYARLAMRLLRARAAFVTLIDDTRVFFKSAIVSAESPLTMPREVLIAASFCPYTITLGAPLLVNDASRDPHFMAHSAVLDFNIIAYAGVPLVCGDGLALGTLCVIDTKPRTWNDDDLVTLGELATAVMTEIERDGKTGDRVGSSNIISNETAGIASRWVLEREDDGTQLAAIATNNYAGALKQAEQALHESEARHRLLYAASPHVAWVFDIDSLEFLDVNPAAVKVYGYSREEFLRMRLTDIRSPDEVPELHAVHRQLLAGENTGGQFLHRKKGGEEIWMETSVQILKDGYAGRRAALVQLTDFTERRRIENALRDREAQFRTLFDSIDEGFCIIELLFDEKYKPIDYRFLECNPKFESLTGLREAVGKTARELVPDLENHWFETYGKVALTGEAVRFVDGSEALNRWFDVYAVRLGGSGSRKVAVIFNNITERKQLEKDRERYINTLQDANRRKDEFLAMLAHELRNPLAPIRNGVQILRSSNGAQDQVERTYDLLERQVAHLTRLVDDLMDVSRVNEGKIALEKSPINVADALKAGIEIARLLIEAKHHNLLVDLPSDPLYVEGDLVRLAQVVGNILDNAAKFTDEQGKIILSLKRENGIANIVVSDTGIGIAPEVLPHVFDLFTQGDVSLDRARGGLGIGLALVKNLIELHGGEVDVESAGLNTGSRISIRLPLVAAPAASSTQAKSALPNTPRRVLVVDDHVDSAESMGELLKLEGHSICYAYEGNSALEKVKAFNPDVALLDIGLPGLDGYELARRMRADERFKHIVLIALTGYGQDKDRARSKEAGFDHHIVKPVEPSNLLALIATLPMTGS